MQIIIIVLKFLFTIMGFATSMLALSVAQTHYMGSPRKKSLSFSPHPPARQAFVLANLLLSLFLFIYFFFYFFLNLILFLLNLILFFFFSFFSNSHLFSSSLFQNASFYQFFNCIFNISFTLFFNFFFNSIFILTSFFKHIF